MNCDKNMQLTSMTARLRENNAQRYSQYLITQRKRQECQKLKNNTLTNRKRLDQSKKKLKDLKKFDLMRKKTSVFWTNLTAQVHDDKSLVMSAIFMQKLAMEKRKEKNEKLLLLIDDRMKTFLRYYNNRPTITQINNLQVTFDLLLKETAAKQTIIVRARAEIQTKEKEFKEKTVSLANAVVKYRKSVRAAEKQGGMKKRIADLERQIRELKIKEEPKKKPYQLNFFADVEWADYEDIQSVQPMSVASPDPQITPVHEQGPLSCLSLDVSTAAVSGEQLSATMDTQQLPSQSQNGCPLQSTHEETGALNSDASSKTLPSSNIDPEAIINEPPTVDYYYNPSEFDASGVYTKSPNPPQSDCSVDFDRQFLAKSPEQLQMSSPETRPPSPDGNMPNFFGHKEEAAKNSAGSFFNFETSPKETSSFFNLF